MATQYRRVGAVARYAGAGLAVASALLLYIALSTHLASPFLTFYPAVMLVAVLAGLGPALVATALSAASVALWILPAFWPGPPRVASGIASLAFFVAICALISVLAKLHALARDRLAEREKVLVEEELREAYARLAEADRRKTEFIGVLSHELRNPLAAIRNGVYVLQRVPAGGREATSARQIIHRQTEHLTRMVDDLLDVTRISRGRIELRRARIDLREVVARCCEDHRALFEPARVALHHEPPASPAWIDADATRIAQVLGNLLQNAAKFTPAGGVVTVQVAPSAGTAEVRVRDTGIGMASEELEHLFEPFTQAEQGLARRRGGLGLGLALSKGLVELHGGTLRARSDGPGRGSEFCAVLPLASAPVPSLGAPGAGREAGGQLVLLIEDNVDTCDSLSVALGLKGHRVRVAHDGTTGIAAARELRPDVILCDIGLPDIDGYEVARALRSDAALRLTRLIALSGYARPEDKERSREAGFEGHVSKPPELDALEDMLAKAPSSSLCGGRVEQDLQLGHDIDRGTAPPS